MKARVFSLAMVVIGGANAVGRPTVVGAAEGGAP